MKTEKPTTAATVGEGRDIALDHKTAKAIADASQKAGFPIPPTAAAVLGTKAAPKRPAAARPKPAAKPKPTTPATPVAAPAVTGAPAADAATKED